MAAAEIEIIYKANSQELKAAVNEISKANDVLVDGAQKSANIIADSYKGAVSNAANAFKGDFLKNAVNGQIKIIQELGKAGTALKPLANSLDETSKRLKIVVESEDDIKKLEDRLRQLSLAGDRSSEEFNAIAQAIGEYKSAITAADRAVDLYAKSTDAATGRIGELEDKLYDLAIAGKQNTKEFNDLVREVSTVKRAIAETDAQVDALSERGARFGAFVQSVELVGSAFQGVEGAAALFGGESEELQQTLVRLNAIMAITAALEQGRTIITEQLAKKTGIATAAQKLFNLATEAGTKSLKGIKGALIATGFGALLVALGAVIAYWDDIKRAITGVSEEQNKLNEQANKNLKFEQDKLEAIDSQDNILKLQGKTEREILELKVKQTEQTILAQEATIKLSQVTLKAQIEAEKRSYETLRNIARFGLETSLAAARVLVAPLDLLIVTANQIAETLGFEKISSTINEQLSNLAKAGSETLAKLAFDPAETERTGKAALAESQKALNDLKNQRAGFQLSIQDIDKKAADDAAAKNKEASDKATEAAKKAAEDQKKAREELAAAELAAFIATLDAQDKIRNEANNKIAELEQKFIDAGFKRGTDEEKKLQTAITQIREDAAKQIAELDKKDLEDKLARDLEALKASADATLQQQIDALAAQRDRELKDADALGKDKAEIAFKYNNEINNLTKQLTESEFNTREANLKRLEIIEGSSVDRRIALIELEAERRRQAAKDNIKDAAELAAQLELINAETQKAIRDERAKTDQEAIDNALKVGKELNEIFGTFIEIQKEQSEQRIQQLTDAAEIEKENINNSVDEYADKNRKLEASELRLQRRIAAEKLKQAKLDKAKAIFDVFLNTAQAVTAAIAGAPLTFGQPFAAFAAAQGILQASLIAAKPLPRFKKGGPVGGRSHEAGGTIIEAEKGEFVVNKQSATRHRDALYAMNQSSDAFKKYIEQRYVRPALLDISTGRKDRGVQVNATLNAKVMEKEIKGLRKDLKNKNTTININGADSRYLWQ